MTLRNITGPLPTYEQRAEQARVIEAAMAEAGYPEFTTTIRYDARAGMLTIFWRHPRHLDEDVRRAVYRAYLLCPKVVEGGGSRCFECFRDNLNLDTLDCEHEPVWA